MTLTHLFPFKMDRVVLTDKMNRLGMSEVPGWRLEGFLSLLSHGILFQTEGSKWYD